MRISQLLIENNKLLKKHKIPNPHFEAEILLSYILKKPREFLLAHPEFEARRSQVMCYELCVTRRIKGEPIAYLAGHKEFYGLDFFVNKNVLIPRPETEMMVEEAFHITHNSKPVTFIDIGTGSGCVIISLCKQLLSCGCPQLRSARFFGIDISKPALAVALKNAKLHGVNKRIKFLYGDLLKLILKNCGGRVLCGKTLLEQNPKHLKYLNNPKYPIIITANLPYLTPAQVKNSPSIQYEPRLALTAGPDGLKYYRRLFKQIKRFHRILPSFSSGIGGFSRPARLKPCEPGLKPGRSARFTILCEIDPSQAVKIKQLVKKELLDANVEIKKDLSGRNRLAIISVNKQ